MAAVLHTQQHAFHQSAHFLAAPNHNRHFGQHHQQQRNNGRQHQEQQQPHAGFEAFAPHHHAGSHSPSSQSSSWRTHPAPIAAAAAAPSAPGRLSPVRAQPLRPSFASKPSSTVIEKKPVATAKPSAPHPAFVYTATDLLRLSRSPLVGVSTQKRAALADFVEHNVWRRGPSTSSSRSRSLRERRPGHSRQSSYASSSSASSTHTTSDSE